MSVLAFQRLAQQRLSQNPLGTAAAVVDWLLAVQGQDYPGTQWAIAQRLEHVAVVDEIEQAFNDGMILRTHVMRPTWHFVTPADIRWLVELTAPRVQAINAYMYRQTELDEALLRRCADLITAELEGGQFRTREELKTVLAQNGVAADTIRLGYIVHYVELEGLICSGPRRGKQFTYGLMAERAPHARVLSRDEALGELTLRYFTAHGPATAHDLAWWSGLTLGDVRNGLTMAGKQLDCDLYDGEAFWFSPANPPNAVETQAAFLLPTYDELFMSYTAHAGSRTHGQTLRDSVDFTSPLVVAGKIIGSWRRTFRGKTAHIDVMPFEPLTPTQQDAIQAAAERFSAFLMMPVTWSANSVNRG